MERHILGNEFGVKVGVLASDVGRRLYKSHFVKANKIKGISPKVGFFLRSARFVVLALPTLFSHCILSLLSFHFPLRSFEQCTQSLRSMCWTQSCARNILQKSTGSYWARSKWIFNFLKLEKDIHSLIMFFRRFEKEWESDGIEDGHFVAQWPIATIIQVNEI